MGRRPGAVAFDGREVSFRISVSLGQVKPGGRLTRHVHVVDETQVLASVRWCQEPETLAARFRTAYNVGLAASCVSLRLSPFVESHIRALLQDLSPSVPMGAGTARDTPTSHPHPNFTRRTAPRSPARHATADAPHSPARPPGAVLGLQLSLQSLNVMFCSHEGETEADIASLGLRHLAMSVAWELGDLDTRLSVEQIALVDHTARAGEAGRAGRATGSGRWDRGHPQVVQVGPTRRHLGGPGIESARDSRGRARVAFCAWRAATAAARPAGAAGAEGWSRIRHSVEHLTPIPSGQVYLALVAPRVGLPSLAVDVSYLGLYLDSAFPRRVLDSAVAFAEGTRAILETWGPPGQEGGGVGAGAGGYAGSAGEEGGGVGEEESVEGEGVQEVGGVSVEERVWKVRGLGRGNGGWLGGDDVILCG